MQRAGEAKSSARVCKDAKGWGAKGGGGDGRDAKGWDAKA